MKKILIASSLLGLNLAGSASAAVGAADISSVAISQGNCALLTEDASVKITLSSGNIGSYQCDTTTANIGLAVASTTGKNKVFSVGSSGGALTVTTTGTSAPSTADTQGAAAVSAGTVIVLQPGRDA